MSDTPRTDNHLAELRRKGSKAKINAQAGWTRVEFTKKLERELIAAQEIMGKAADQLKRGEWNSCTSGTWQLLNDAIDADKLSTAKGEKP